MSVTSATRPTELTPKLFTEQRLLCPFSICCPPLIRDYDRYAEYADVGKGGDYLLHQFINSERLSGSYIAIKADNGGNVLRPRNHIELGYVYRAMDFITKFTTGDEYGGINYERKYGEELAVEPIGYIGAGLFVFIVEFKLESPFEPYVGTTSAEPVETPIYRGSPLEVKPNQVDAAYWHARNHSEDTKYVQRGGCTFFYYVGFAAFAWVAFQSFITVVRILL